MGTTTELAAVTSSTNGLITPADGGGRAEAAGGPRRERSCSRLMREAVIVAPVES